MKPTNSQIRYELGPFRAFLASIGNPQDHLPPAILVAGTNGKGSTLTYMASVLRQAGCRVGTYTSPHLVSYTERYGIDGSPISEASLLALRARLDRMGGADTLTEFERLTVLAFWLFGEAGLDYVIFEVGLGGRLDATNVVTPIISVITKIGYDHQAILGDSLAEIASEKAGIIRPHTPVVTLDTQHPEALAMIQRIASSLESPLTMASPRATIPAAYRMQGGYQRENMALATAALKKLRPSISEDTLQRGLESAVIWGRGTVLETSPSTTVIADVAHNVDGVDALIQHLRVLAPTVRPVFIVGFYGPKDGPAMLQPLLDYGDVYYCEFDETAWSFAELAAITGPDRLHRFELDHAGHWPAAPLVVVTGSIYFLGKIKTRLETQRAL